MSKPPSKGSRLTTRLVPRLLLCLLLLFTSMFSAAKTEQDIKAVYLFNFLKFIDWPTPESQENFTLCMIGDDPITEKVFALDSKKAHKLDISVKSIHNQDQSHCDVVFIGESEKKFMERILIKYAHSNTLTVSSLEGFAQQGGMIGFVPLGNVIRFDINFKQVKAANLKISSKLLELANEVVQ